MVTIIPEGFTFQCENDVITFKLHDTENNCCEIMTRQCFPDVIQTTQQIKTWSQIKKSELPDSIQKLEDLNNDQWEDKMCELVAIKLTFEDETTAHLVVANKHNGYYCHQVTIESSETGLVYQTYI